MTILTTDARVDPRFAAGESIKIHGISSALCAPLIVDDQALGVVYLESSLSKGGFKREDEHLLSAMANFAAVGIQRERETRFRQRLERYHSPQVVGEILKAAQNLDAPLLQARRCEISVLFADISGFTRMSEGMEPLQLASILNRSFEVMTEQIFLRGGTLDKYIGDAIMAFFGAPAPDPDHARHAVDAAMAMQQGLQEHEREPPGGLPGAAHAHRHQQRRGLRRGHRLREAHGLHGHGRHGEPGLPAGERGGPARPDRRRAAHGGTDRARRAWSPIQPVSLKGIEHKVQPVRGAVGLNRSIWQIGQSDMPKLPARQQCGAISLNLRTIMGSPGISVKQP